jgi:hypothetical protein
MTRPPFIERHALWTDDQRRQAEALRERVRTEALRLLEAATLARQPCEPRARSRRLRAGQQEAFPDFGEVDMRESIKERKRLMQARPAFAVRREP